MSLDPSEATSSPSSSAPSSQVTAIQIWHDSIQLNRKRAADGQLAQAERMLKRNRLVAGCLKPWRQCNYSNPFSGSR